MKKILGSLLLIFVLVSFSSCKREAKIIVDTPSDEITVALGLADVKNGKALNVDKDTSAAYYDVRVSNDLTGSLFYQTINVNEYVSNDISFNLKPLIFNQYLANSANTTLAELINILNSETEGISKEDLGIDLVDDENSNYLVGNLTPVNNIEFPANIEANSADQVQLVVVYMPIYGVYYYSSKQYTNVFVMVPVYYAITNTSTVSNYVGSVKNYQCTLQEVAQNVWVLPSKSE